MFQLHTLRRSVSMKENEIVKFGDEKFKIIKIIINKNDTEYKLKKLKQ